VARTFSIGLGALLVVSATVEARGDTLAPLDRLEYVAPPGCPTRRVLENDLIRRGGRTTPEVSIAVVVRRTGRVFVGRLEIGPGNVRTIGGASCQEVVEALALIASLYVQRFSGSASTQAAPEPPAAVAPPQGPPLEPTQEIVRNHRASTRWVFTGGASAAVVYGTAPALAPGVAVFVDVRRSGVTPWQPSLRLGYAWARSDAGIAGGGRAGFDLQVGSVDVCPARITFFRFAVTPCLGIDIGALQATSTGVDGARTDRRLWLAPSASGRLEFAVVRHFDLFLQGAIAVPLVRERFYLEPSTTIFEVPAVAARGTIGAQAWF
jgi:hypothetical protein